ncbi:SpoIIE family protein phosphatase [Streptomyces tagetis]|uniref:SpoIIE family protein phosphatase n=1 Tax=Streptomyces tagetis TaxID=2820809 RepID=A0A940XLU9_9ACTN|nr:SpoIIE family protein phosphatase [Streptomyces sp. RG38]MBQ0830734.1 SpoIIE family protein phosphatase [Streptomyces sp. RG38]
MGAIPTQRENASRALEAPAPAGQAPAWECARAHTTLLGSSLAPGAARALVRTALADWSGSGLPGTELLTDRLAADALVVASELVTNAVVHAGTDVELVCRLEETGAIVIEATDRHPARAPRGGDAEPPPETPEYGRGLRLVATLSEAWGITYRTGAKTVWARLPATGNAGPAGAYATGAGLPDGAEVPVPRSRADADADGRRVPGAGEPAGASGPGPEVAGESALPVGPGGPAAPAAAPAAADRPPPAPGPDGDTDPDTPTDADADAYAHMPTETGPDPARLDHRPPVGRDREWLGRGALSFLAEASDLLAGQLDEDLIASLTGQLIVPRLADWCAVWLEDESLGRGAWSDDTGATVGARLARVWHGSEHHVEELRLALEKEPPRAREPWRSGPAEHPWPAGALGPRGTYGTALAYRLVAGGRPLGTLVIGRCGAGRFPDEISGLVEDLSRRVALAIGTARQYARQATISAVLQRGLLPGAVAEIPGMRSALVYEPWDKGGPSGDFYDLFPAGAGRWCFAVGDVQGKGPEAAVVIGLARPWLRLLAREGYDVPDVLDRLNQLLLDDATEAADAAARALVAVGGPPVAPGDGPQTRFLSLLYGELVPVEDGVRCTLASAGHPLPLLLGPDGGVRVVARPQTLLGVVEDATYTSETFELRRGETLLCVTDGVTERRSGSRQFDDGDGLAAALAGCAGLDAAGIAERIRRLVHEFGDRPPEDDLALLVLQAE